MSVSERAFCVSLVWLHIVWLLTIALRISQSGSSHFSGLLDRRVVFNSNGSMDVELRGWCCFTVISFAGSEYRVVYGLGCSMQVSLSFMLVILVVSFAGNESRFWVRFVVLLRWRVASGDWCEMVRVCWWNSWNGLVRSCSGSTGAGLLHTVLVVQRRCHPHSGCLARFATALCGSVGVMVQHRYWSCVAGIDFWVCWSAGSFGPVGGWSNAGRPCRL